MHATGYRILSGSVIPSLAQESRGLTFQRYMGTINERRLGQRREFVPERCPTPTHQASHSLAGSSWNMVLTAVTDVIILSRIVGRNNLESGNDRITQKPEPARFHRGTWFLSLGPRPSQLRNIAPTVQLTFMATFWWSMGPTN
jgi:hypothetical protein